MISKKLIEDFLSVKDIAVIGVSRNGKKFGHVVYKELKSKGYNVYPVNPNTSAIDNEKCYPSLIALQGKIKAAIVVIKPFAAKEAVKDAYEIGIKKIWLQPGSESDETISYCKEAGIDVIHNECVLMFAEPAAFFHRAHRWINKVSGKLPG